MNINRFLKSSEFYLIAFHYASRASLVAQMVKRLPVVPETRVLSLGWEDPLEKGMTAHSSRGVVVVLCDLLSWSK